MISIKDAPWIEEAQTSGIPLEYEEEDEFLDVGDCPMVMPWLMDK